MKAFEEGATMPKMIEEEKAETTSSSKDVEISGIEEKPVLTAKTAVVVKKKISAKKAEVAAEKPTVAVEKQALKAALKFADKYRVACEAWAEDSKLLLDEGQKQGLRNFV